MKTISKLLLCILYLAVTTAALADQEVSVVVQRDKEIPAQDTPKDIYVVQLQPPAGGGAMQQLEISKPGDSAIMWRFLDTPFKERWNVKVLDSLGNSICQSNNVRFLPPPRSQGLEAALAKNPLGKPRIVEELKRALFIKISASRSDKRPATCVISVVKDTKKE